MEQKTMKKTMMSIMKAHQGSNMAQVVAHQGQSLFFRRPSTEFAPQNPLTKSGKKVMQSMSKEYGPKKAKQVFYASINKNKPGSSAWHK